MTRLRRWFDEVGVSLYVGLALAAVLFVLGSEYIVWKADEGTYLYPIIGISFVLSLGDRDRRHMLLTIYDRSVVVQIRVLENTIVALPFVLFLIYRQEFLLGSLLLLVSWILSFSSYRFRSNFVIPTPFAKRPFEFTVGFRKSFLYIVGIYFVLMQAVIADNYNLAVATIGFLCLLTMSYYITMEYRIYVWMHDASTRRFSKGKVRTAMYSLGVIRFPAFSIVCLFFVDQISQESK